MVSDHVVPGNPDQRDGLVVRLHDIEIVKNDVTEGDAKRSVMGVVRDDLLDYIVLHVLDLGDVARLRVAEHDCAELVWFNTFAERKVN